MEKSKLTNRAGEIGRATFDVIVPIFGDIDMYYKRRTKQNMEKGEAILDMVPSLILKYLTYSIAAYKLLK